jgi:hypothetical protein
VGGALSETGLIEVAAEAGLLDGRIVERFDCYAGTSSGAKVAPHMGLTGLNFHARR